MKTGQQVEFESERGTERGEVVTFLGGRSLEVAIRVSTRGGLVIVPFGEVRIVDAAR